MATEATTNSGDTQNDKPTYSPEQQAHINTLIQEAMGRAGREAREKADRLDAEATTAKAALAAAQAELAKASTKSDKASAKEDVDNLKARIAEMETARSGTQAEVERLKSQLTAQQQEVLTARSEAINVRKQSAITNAASKINFVNTEVVSKLTQDSVKYDEQKGRFVVLNDQGQERLNASFEPMSLDEFYTEFAAKNPYLVRGDVKAGTGSTESKRFDVSQNGKFEVKQIFGRESSSVLAAKLMKEDPKEYHRLKEIAKNSGLVPK